MLAVDDIKRIAERIEYRMETFDEPFLMSVGVVLANYGDSFTRVSCVGPEAWQGTKTDAVSLTHRIPTCPNGHPLLEHDGGLRLALVPAVESRYRKDTTTEGGDL